MRRTRRICLRYSTEPSIFYGGLGEGIKKSFAQIGKRFTFGGDTGRVREFTILIQKKFPGTNSEQPPPFRSAPSGRKCGKLSVGLRCNGMHIFIQNRNPLLFYTNVSGNVTDTYDRSEIDDTLKGELLNALQPVLAKISASELHILKYRLTQKLPKRLKKNLPPNGEKRRGLEIFFS